MATKSISFTPLATEADLDSVEPAWRELFDRSGSRSVFAHPGWLRTWLRTFVPDEGRRVVLAIERGGELVGLAPFYRRPVGRARTLQLAGAPTQEDPLTELSEIVVLPEARNAVLRALLDALVTEHSAGCDWIGLTLPGDHGWFNDHWIPDTWRNAGAFSVHKSARPFSVLPLADSWEEQPLKRNLRNAINRSENRHAQLDTRVELRFADSEHASEAALTVQRLHRMRASATRGQAHRDYFRDGRVARLAVDGVAALARDGKAYVGLCEVDGAPVAGRVVLRSGGTAFFGYSGLDPEHWQLSSQTLLTVAIAQRAIANGDRSLNLSLNPDAAKQRWTQQIEVHNEFIVVAPSRRARVLFSLFWQARFARVLRQRRETAANGADEDG